MAELLDHDLRTLLRDAVWVVDNKCLDGPTGSPSRDLARGRMQCQPGSRNAGGYGSSTNIKSSFGRNVGPFLLFPTKF